MTTSIRAQEKGCRGSRIPRIITKTNAQVKKLNLVKILLFLRERLCKAALTRAHLMAILPHTKMANGRLNRNFHSPSSGSRQISAPCLPGNDLIFIIFLPFPIIVFFKRGEDSFRALGFHFNGRSCQIRAMNKANQFEP